MADAKLTALTALTAPISTDITYVVDDPGTTPLSKKVTLANLGKGLVAGNIPNVAAGTVAATNVQAAIDELDTEKAAVAQTMYIGSTAVAINRATASLALTGITSIDGSSASCVGQSATVATIAGLAPDTQNTYARTQYLIPYASTTAAFGEIAIGASGEVLTSNGAGSAATFQAAASSPTGYDASVGSSGADYTDIQAAITGVGGTDIKLLLITDITEDSDIAVGGLNLVINLSSYTLTTNAFNFTYASAGNVFIYGNGVDSGAEIDYNNATNEQVFENSGFPASITELRDLVLDNNSGASANGTYLSDGVERIFNVRIELNNDSDGGFGANVDDSTYENIHFVGGGAACEDVLQAPAGIRVISTNLLFTGTFHATNDIFQVNDDHMVSNVMCAQDTAKMQIKVNSGRLDNIMTDGTQDIDIFIIGNSSRVTNAELGGGDLSISFLDWNQISCVRTTGSLIDGGAVNNLITNCKFDTAFTLVGDRNKLNNCDFIGGVSVSNGADNNSLVNCQAGADAGGGAATITIVATAVGTRIIGCMTDVAIVDGGSGTESWGNTIY